VYEHVVSLHQQWHLSERAADVLFKQIALEATGGKTASTLFAELEMDDFKQLSQVAGALQVCKAALGIAFLLLQAHCFSSQVALLQNLSTQKLWPSLQKLVLTD
jgi:hypothetical protein